MANGAGSAAAGTGAHGLFSSGLVRRFSLLLLASTFLPMLVLGLLHDRYTRSLLGELTGQQLSTQLAGTANRLRAFLDGHAYQLERIARYPAAGIEGKELSLEPGEEFSSMVRLDADEMDLYGVLFFSDDGALVRAVAGQAAAGPPYWEGPGFSLEGLPRRPLRDTEVVGPLAPGPGRSGWFLIQERLHGGGSIALHVRLASLTELLGATAVPGVLKPVLRTPAGDFDLIGQPTVIHGEVREGPEIAAGWRPCLLVDPDELLRPFQAARFLLLAVSLLALAIVAALSTGAAGRVKRRVEQLAQGAERLSAGDFSFRVPESGNDEISLFAETFNRMAARLGELIENTVRVERLTALGQFSAGIAHEVRNPLATLKTTVQALERLERDPQRLSLLGDMEDEIDRMSRTIREVLAFSRPHPPKRAEVRLREVAQRLETLLAAEARGRGLVLAFQGDLDLAVLGDPDQLMQILMNLLLNALQATPRGGLVSFCCYRDDGKVVIEVRDTGQGIAAEKLQEVFKPFYTTKQGGTGLGLSISRQFAELNGGALTLDSTTGHGTTAHLSLCPAPPRPEGAAPAAHSEEHSEEDPDG